MSSRILKYEWRNASADRTPLAIALLLGLAIAFGAYNGSRWVDFQNQTLRAALAEERTRLDAIREQIPQLESGEKKVPPFTDPRLPQSFGRNLGTRYVTLPPAPLASLAIGQSDLHPYYFRVSINSKDTFLNNDEIENPIHLLAGRFDLAFVFLYLFPLVILAFSYNLISAEKETGTLALALSQPVSLARLVAAKISLRAMFVLALAASLSIAGVAIGGADLGAPDAPLRLLLWVVTAALYGGFWFALAIAVNTLGRGSATNAIALAGCWLLFLIVIPSVLNVAVKAAHPVPSRVELIQAIRAAGEDSTRQGSQLLARYLEDHPELAPPESKPGTPPDFSYLQVALNDAIEKKVQPVLETFERQLAHQRQLVDRFRYLSPAIVAQSAFDDLAGSSGHRYMHFLAQVDTYHRRWRQFFIPRILKKQPLSAGDLDHLPIFIYKEEETYAVVSRLSFDLFGLAFAFAAISILALRKLRSYPVAG